MSWRILHICEPGVCDARWPRMYPDAHATAKSALRRAVELVEAVIAEDPEPQRNPYAPRHLDIIVAEGKGGPESRWAHHTVRVVWSAHRRMWSIYPADRARLLDTPGLGVVLHLGDIPPTSELDELRARMQEACAAYQTLARAEERAYADDDRPAYEALRAQADAAYEAQCAATAAYAARLKVPPS